MEELKHHGVPGMKWGHRKAMKIQARKDKSIQRYKEIQSKNPNSKKALRAKKKSEIVNASKYGKTGKRILAEGALKHIGSIGLQTAAATALIATGATVTAPAIAAIGAVSIGAIGTTHRVANAISTLHKARTHTRKK